MAGERRGSTAVAGEPAPAAAAVDASMDLLNQILRQPYDPDYPVVAARGLAPQRVRIGLAVVLLVIGAMFAVSTLQTSRTAPQAERERSELIDRVRAAQDRQEQLTGQVAQLTAENAGLRRSALGNDAGAVQTQARLDALSLPAAAVAVSGPGLRLTLDDAPDSTEAASSVVTAQDVQVLVNALWSAGAEAVAVNGHRLSSLTALRQAGSALTVDYSSITHPYVVEAIGDPRTLPAAYAQTAGSDWWETLKNGPQMRYDVAAADHLSLAADPGLTLRYARPADAEPSPSGGAK